MIKKSNELTEAENIVSMGGLADQDLLREGGLRTTEPLVARRNVNLMIHGWLTDIWLLTTGEECATDHYEQASASSHGRPLALLSDGQMRLLGHRAATLEALRDVGIEMS
jgi:hypothetical protein